ncbi:MAG: PD-(D/E)XK nuclease family protein [Clostridiales bacterium]|nr:PD-(D/E)XK nuclease family protein [Clostridiales bacterium]
MIKTILCPTLDDALTALAECTAENERQGRENLVFCEDRLTLLAERAILNKLGGTFLTEVTTLARFLTPQGRILSKQGSVMEIAALIEEHRTELKCFHENSASAVYETIAQLSASRVTAQMLRDNAEETEGLLRFKLNDLALLLECYNEFLQKNELLDENGYLTLLPQEIASGKLRSTNVFFFAFSSFTKQALEGVCACAEHAGSVTGIFLGGEAEIYTNEAQTVFLRMAEEYGGTKRESVKCTLNEDALLLRNVLFAPDKLPTAPRKTSRVHAFAAVDEADEMNTVAALIKKQIHEGMRYSDLAVLVPDKQSFTVAEKTFTAYCIPFYADKKRSFAEHPFCAFALSVLHAVHNGVLPEDADAICSNLCFGDGDEFRNYLLKFGGYRGAAKREIKSGEAVKGYNRESLSACRERLVAILSLFPARGKGTGQSFAAAVRALKEFVGWEKLAEGMTLSAEEKRFLEISPLDSVLTEIETVAGGRSFTAREFASVLESGLSALEISMIPQYADAVFVGDITESRIARAKVLFAVGLSDELPRVTADTAVITDREMKRLSALQTEIEPAVEQVNRRAREALSLNLCAFENELYLSRSLRRGGEESHGGEIPSYIRKTFHPQPMPALFPYECSERTPAMLKLLALKHAFEQGAIDADFRFQRLRDALYSAGEQDTTDALLYGGEKREVSQAGELYFAGGTVSPTLLEGYFSCPYAGFITRGLRVREREERMVLDTDTGTFVHAVLERVADKLNELNTEEACRAYARETGAELLASPRFSALADTAAGVYTGERLITEGEEVSAAAYRQLANSAFRVKSTEGKVEIPSLSLAGTADRIDEAEGYVRVIDYKTGAIDESPTSYYTGRKLQLQLYLSAAAQQGKAAGAFYFPAADTFVKPDVSKYKMKGFYCGEDGVVSLLDKTLKSGDKSELFEGSLNGKFTDKAMPQDDFEAFLGYSALVSAKAEEEMKAGNIKPTPYEGACVYCKLKSLCGFVGTPRSERAVKCADIAKIVKKERGEQ